MEAPDKVTQWRAAEADAIGVFELAFGTRAPPPARQLGGGLVPRLVFGWPALVEKLRCEELGLDDVTLEMTKIAIMHDGPHGPWSLTVICACAGATTTCCCSTGSIRRLVLRLSE